MIVIPAINCPDKDLECVAEKVRCVEKIMGDASGATGEGWIHLDVADARFTFNRTWGDPGEWKKTETPLKLEAHLMVEEPEKAVPQWFKADMRRAIVHLEAIIDPRLRENPADPKEVVKILLAECAKGGSELMLAVNPETPIMAAAPYFEHFSAYQILAVHPGFASQKFLPLVLDKIRVLRRELPRAKIEVDGGISPETARLVKDAGADIICSASYIFGSADPRRAYEELRSI